MIEAAIWGGAAASSLILGAVLAFVVDIPARLRGLILAFGAGILFGSVAYELVEEALRVSLTGFDVALGFGLGAVVFYVGSVAIERRFGGDGAAGGSRRGARAAGLAIVLGTILDGLPESIVLGLSLTPSGVALPILVAIFLSNVPEGLSATEDLVNGGIERGRVLGLWVLVVLSSAAAAAIGFALLDAAPVSIIVGAQAFAAGAILAMLAESMIPEAYEIGGRPVGLATAMGFALAAWLSLRP